MRILVALIAVFMVSGAVATEDRKTTATEDRPPPDYDVNDIVVKVECQLSGNNNGDIHAQEMPKQLSGAELQQLCLTWPTR